MVSEAQAKQYAENLLKAQAKRQEINAMVRFLKNESTYLSINGWKEGKKMKYYNDGDDSKTYMIARLTLS
jgi:hypothetical protein